MGDKAVILSEMDKTLFLKRQKSLEQTAKNTQPLTDHFAYVVIVFQLYIWNVKENAILDSSRIGRWTRLRAAPAYATTPDLNEWKE